MGREFKTYADAGRLVPDGLVNSLVVNRLASPNCDNGFLLDGYPRTLDQARALDCVLERRGRMVDHVLLLEVPDAVLIERITGRRTDPGTGRVYHLRFDPPPAAVLPGLVHRADDTEAVLARRLAEYHRSTDALVPYYQQKKVLRPINGVGSLEEVRRRTLAALHAALAPPPTGRLPVRTLGSLTGPGLRSYHQHGRLRGSRPCLVWPHPLSDVEGQWFAGGWDRAPPCCTSWSSVN